MGTWGPGPFDGDAAADFLEELRASPSRAVSRALQTVTKAADSDYLDADVGGAAWAACEVVALSFGYGDTALTDAALEGVGKVVPKEKQRALALTVLSRIAKSATSELAALWHEGSDGQAFDVSLDTSVSVSRLRAMALVHCPRRRWAMCSALQLRLRRASWSSSKSLGPVRSP